MNYDVGFIQRSSSGVHLIPSDSLLRERRILMLDETMTTDSVNAVIQKLMVLSIQSSDPIVLVVNCPGGDIQAGLALIDTIHALRCPVHAVVLGIAASMAAVVLASADRRMMSKHSRTMIHEPLLSNGVSGSCSSIQATARAIEERKNLVNGLLSRYTGRTLEEIENATSYDHFMSAQESVEFGLADSVCSDEELRLLLEGVNPNDFS